MLLRQSFKPPQLDPKDCQPVAQLLAPSSGQQPLPPVQKHVHAAAIDSYTGAFLPCCAVADTVAAWNAPRYGSHDISV